MNLSCESESGDRVEKAVWGGVWESNVMKNLNNLKETRNKRMKSAVRYKVDEGEANDVQRNTKVKEESEITNTVLRRKGN